jgi:hypothetical protein
VSGIATSANANGYNAGDPIYNGPLNPGVDFTSNPDGWFGVVTISPNPSFPSTAGVYSLLVGGANGTSFTIAVDNTSSIPVNVNVVIQDNTGTGGAVGTTFATITQPVTVNGYISGGQLSGAAGGGVVLQYDPVAIGTLESLVTIPLSTSVSAYDANPGTSYAGYLNSITINRLVYDPGPTYDYAWYYEVVRGGATLSLSNVVSPGVLPLQNGDTVYWIYDEYPRP